MMVPPGYLDATKALTAALGAELDALKRARVSQSGEDWDKLVAAHSAAVAAKALCDSLEPDWLR